MGLIENNNTEVGGAVSNKEKLFDALTQDQKMKLEIASELGLLEQVQRDGWKSLSSKETGRIGGLMTKKKREIKKNQEEE
ncbi:MAG TPA: small, acid-soluble spore protein, alpha/beta type [Epulopiscium sp.]|nr:small, acid-soluble spore protein, alpha/beta type [Candidatus Epulonipiscium sp.]